MRTIHALFTLTLFTAVLLTGCADLPTAVEDDFAQTTAPSVDAHESNNRAELTGDGVTGKALVNFVKGSSSWRSNVSLDGDLEAGTYGFYLISPDGLTATLMCTFTVEAEDRRRGCSSDANVGGFASAEVRDDGGIVIASGVFERRGGNLFG